jgi:hypothetical protein
MKIKFFELKESDKQIKGCKRYDIVGLKEIFVMDKIDHTIRFFGSAALLRVSEYPGYAQLCKVYRETDWGVLTAEFTPLVTEDNERILIHLDRDDIGCFADSGEMDYDRAFKKFYPKPYPDDLHINPKYHHYYKDATLTIYDTGCVDYWDKYYDN